MRAGDDSHSYYYWSCLRNCGVAFAAANFVGLIIFWRSFNVPGDYDAAAGVFSSIIGADCSL